MIKAVILDADGVIFDSMEMWGTVGERYLATLGITAKPDLRESIRAMTFGESAKFVRENYQVNLEISEIIEGFRSVIGDFYEREVTLKGEIRKFLEDCRKRNIPMVVLSATEESLLMKGLSHTDTLGYIDKVFSCENLGLSKHEAEVFQLVADYLGEKPEDILLLEDSLYAVETAKKLSMQVGAIFDEASRHEWDDMVNLADFSADFALEMGGYDGK